MDTTQNDLCTCGPRAEYTLSRNPTVLCNRCEGDVTRNMIRLINAIKHTALINQLSLDDPTVVERAIASVTAEWPGIMNERGMQGMIHQDGR
ncbi:hypothetical protein LCGC14_2445470 [marine sediment metagenome]|uniref:Uncharacterized protein n=1 Tax=marine sediment metagenome TaxID=412755 RepID=A0A0F9DUT9_9ZZZZ